MDASDQIRKLQNQAIYSYYKQTKLAPQAACNYSTCSSINGCVVNYPSYEERQKVLVGQAVCNSCANTSCSCRS